MTDMTTQVVGDRLPRPIVQKLRRLVHRARLVILLRGLCTVAVTFVIALLAVMAIDSAITFLPSWPRWVMTSFIVVATVVATFSFLLHPLARSFTLAGVARAIEVRHPELQERISSAVELAMSPDAPEIRGSEALNAALVAEASHDVELLRPRREVTLRNARPRLVAALCAFALLVALNLLWPEQTARLIARALAPFLNLPNVAAYQLAVTPGDTVIRPGDALRVEVLVANNAVRAANLHRLSADKGRRVQEMVRLADTEDGRRQFVVTCPPARDDFHYRVHAGDALSRYFRARVVPPPAVTGLDVRYDYPAYSQMEPYVEEDFTGDIEGVVGTTVTLTAHVSKPVVKGRVLLNDGAAPLAHGKCTVTDEGEALVTCEFVLTPETTGYWALAAEDEHGFTNPSTRHLIEALPDRAPEAQITHPRQTELRCRPDDSVPILYAVRDDLGLVKAQILRKKDGLMISPLPVPLPLGDGPCRNASGETALDLSEAELAGARLVKFQLSATDNLPVELEGPQEGLSRIYTITIDFEAPPYLWQLRSALDEEIRRSLEAVRGELEAAKAESGPLKEEAPKEPELSEPSRQRLDQMAQHLTTAEQDTRDLTDMLEKTPYESLTPRLETLADEHIAGAGETTEQVETAESPEQRGALAEQADSQIEEAIAAVDELIDEFDVMAETLGRMQQLEELAQTQEQLFEEKAGLAPDADEMPMTDQEWAETQDQVAEDLADMLRQTPGGLEAQARLDQERMRDLAQDARELQKDQQDLAGDTKRLDEIQTIDETLLMLADAQKELAKRAAAEELTAQQEEGMSKAAEDILAGELYDAIREQKDAERNLGGKADQLQREQAAADLVAKAEQLARKQKDLADKTARTREGMDEAQALQQALTKADELQREQEALAEQAKGLAERVGQNPATKGTEQPEPSPRMAEAADRLKQGKTQEAVAAAQQAAEQAKEMSRHVAEAQRKAAEDSDAPVEAKQATHSAAQLAKEAEQVASAQKKLSEQMAKLPTDLQRGMADPEKPARDLAQAQEQIAQMATTQEQVRKEADQLAEAAKQATAQAQSAVRQHDPRGQMQQAEQALQKQQAPKAQEASAQAAQRAEEMAAALRELNEQTPPLPNRRPRADQIAKMATDQKEVREQVEDLARRRPQLEQQLLAAQMARLQAEQADAAREAADIAERTDTVAPQQDQIQDEAAQEAGRAADQMQAQDVPAAAQSASAAAQDLGELAGRLQEAERAAAATPRQAEQSPAERAQQLEQTGDLARDTADLAERQQGLAEEMQALAEELMPALLGSRQQGLSRATQDLGVQTQALRERLQPLFPEHDAQQAAARAADHLAEAARSQQQAEQAFAAESLDQAVPQQMASAEQLGQAAEALDQLGELVQQAVEEGLLPDLDQSLAQDSLPLSQSFDAASEAAQTQATPEAALASDRLDAALQQMAARAQRMGLQPFSLAQQIARDSTYETLTLDSKTGIAGIEFDPATVELQDAGITLDEWARLPSELRSDILQAAAERGPAEYRALIKRYFHEIARRGGAEPDGNGE